MNTKQLYQASSQSLCNLLDTTTGEQHAHIIRELAERHPAAYRNITSNYTTIRGSALMQEILATCKPRSLEAMYL
jgi:hypothetical protein